MKAKTRKIIGWSLSGLISAFLIFASASGKFIDFEGKEEMFAEMGWSVETMFAIGIVEVVVALLFLVPRISFYGAILLSAYLGGATATHVRMGDAFFMPVIIGVLAWVALGLRDSGVFALATFKRNDQ